MGSFGKHRKSAFTLAEILVSLGIIGVISALTVPTLVQNYQRQTFATQLHKVYSDLSQAAQQAKTDSRVSSLDESKYSRATGPEEFITTYFKITQNCGASLVPCFANSYQTMGGDAIELENPIFAATLADGAAIAVFNNFFRYSEGVYHGNFDLEVDVNGSKGPNILGRDLFYMGLYSDGLVRESYNNDYENIDGCENVNSVYGSLCLSRIIKDGWRMTY